MARDNDELKPAKDSKAGPNAGSLSPGAKASLSNGAAAAPGRNAGDRQHIDPAVLEKFTGMRSKVYEAFGKVVLALAASPRHRHLSVGDLLPLIFDPLLNDRVAIAHAAKPEAKFDEGSLAGIAIWASVSEQVDAKIREQIKAGVFPVRLKPDEWASGKINWLLDLVAPSPQLATAVIANFKQVVKGGEMHIHPLVSSLLDGETLRKMGAAAGLASGGEKA